MSAVHSVTHVLGLYRSRARSPGEKAAAFDSQSRLLPKPSSPRSSSSNGLHSIQVRVRSRNRNVGQGTAAGEAAAAGAGAVRRDLAAERLLRGKVRRRLQADQLGTVPATAVYHQ